jgi:hypothetical protein
MPTKAEAHTSEQRDIYEHACLLWELMDDATRQKFEKATVEVTKPKLTEGMVTTANPIFRAWNKATKAQQCEFAVGLHEVIQAIRDDYLRSRAPKASAS